MAEKIDVNVKFDRSNFAVGEDKASSHAYVDSSVFENFMSRLEKLLSSGMSADAVYAQEVGTVRDKISNLNEKNSTTPEVGKTKEMREFKKNNPNASAVDIKNIQKEIEAKKASDVKKKTAKANAEAVALRNFAAEHGLSRFEDPGRAYTYPQQQANEAQRAYERSKENQKIAERNKNVREEASTNWSNPQIVADYREAGQGLKGKAKKAVQWQYLMDNGYASSVGSARQIVEDIEGLPKEQRTNENIGALITSKARQEELKRVYSQNTKKGLEPSSTQKSGI